MEVTSEDLYCIGCGALIQTEDAGAMGYLPASALAKKTEDNALYCQRCFRLRHYSEIVPSELTDKDFLAILRSFSKQNVLIVNVADIFDFNGSLIADLPQLTGNNDIFLVANKRDILPHSLKVGRLTAWIKEQAAASDIVARDVAVISAQKKSDVQALMMQIEELRQGRDVVVVGMTNVGKSTLINSIVQLATGDSELITTSRFPGTTLDKIEIPLDDESVLIDTPGIIQAGQMAHLLAAKDLKFVSPKKEIKPRTFQLNAEQTLFIGGLARFDFVSGPRQGIAAYFDNELNIHRTKLAGADDFWERHVGEMLTPTVVADFVRQEFSVSADSDVVIAGLGWIHLADKARIAIFAPEGVEIVIRKALI